VQIRSARMLSCLNVRTHHSDSHITLDIVLYVAAVDNRQHVGHQVSRDKRTDVAAVWSVDLLVMPVRFCVLIAESWCFDFILLTARK